MCVCDVVGHCWVWYTDWKGWGFEDFRNSQQFFGEKNKERKLFQNKTSTSCNMNDTFCKCKHDKETNKLKAI